MHHRVSWLFLLTGVLITLLKPTTDYVDSQLHRFVGWLSPTALKPEILQLTFPQQLTDLEKKIRLNNALNTMSDSPPAALILGGDWSHSTPPWVKMESSSLSIDNSIENNLEKLAQHSLLAAPLYLQKLNSSRHIANVSTNFPVPMDLKKIPFWWSWIHYFQSFPEMDDPQSFLLKNLQETVQFSGLSANSYPAELLWVQKDNKSEFNASLALALYLKNKPEKNDQNTSFSRDLWNITKNSSNLNVSLNGTIWPRFQVHDIRSDALALLDNQTRQLWKDKTVFIIPTNDESLKTTAATLASLQANAWDFRPGWDLALVMVFILLASSYFWLLANRFSQGTQILFLALVITLLMISQYVLAITKHWWLSGVLLSLWMVFCALGIGLFENIEKIFLRYQKTRDEANQMLSIASSEKGELATAFGYLKRCSGSTYTKDLLYELAQQMERKREYQLAIKTYQQLLSLGDKNHENLHKKISQLQQAENLSTDSNGLNPARTMVLSNTGLQKLQLGRYQTDSIIGQGSMGVVYLGSDPKIGRSVAIKTLDLSSEYAGSDLEEAKSRFYREAETAGALRHPNIVTIYDVGEEKDLAYIAMDYLKGRPLSDFVKKESLLPVKVVYDLMLQAAQALDYAHSQKIVHRDIKPGNLVYDADKDEVIITDFGIACVTDHSKTRTGTILGSPFYMSPEQIAGAKVDGRADIFSLGVTFYQLLTGELPFNGESLATLTYSIANQKHVPVRKQRSDLPASATTIINKALQKKKDKRYKTAAEMADAIETAMNKIKD